MDIERFMEENGIAILARTDLQTGEVRTWEHSAPLESRTLYERLVVYTEPADMAACLEGQLLPQTWRQGRTRAVICLPERDVMVSLFLDHDGDATEFYRRAKELSEAVCALYGQ